MAKWHSLMWYDYSKEWLVLCNISYDNGFGYLHAQFSLYFIFFTGINCCFVSFHQLWGKANYSRRRSYTLEWIIINAICLTERKNYYSCSCLYTKRQFWTTIIVTNTFQWLIWKWYMSGPGLSMDYNWTFHNLIVRDLHSETNNG